MKELNVQEMREVEGGLQVLLGTRRVWGWRWDRRGRGGFGWGTRYTYKIFSNNGRSWRISEFTKWD